MKVNYRISDVVANVVRSIWHRKWAVGLSLAGVAVCIATVCANSQICISMYESAKSKLDPLAIRKVTLTVNEARQSQGVTGEQLLSLKSDAHIESATPLYELQVTIECPGKSPSILAVLESAEPDDPAFANSRMISGTGLSGVTNEIVLGASLANRLGIASVGRDVDIRVERTTDGKTQIEKRSYRVVGVVQGDERAYVKPDTARSLDLWISHATRKIGEERNHGPEEYSSALVWTSEQAATATILAGRMGLKLTHLRQASIPRFGGNNWFRLTDVSVAGEVNRTQLHPVYIRPSAKGTLVALAENDPRWQILGKPSNDSCVVPIRDRAMLGKLIGERLARSAVGLTTPAGLVLQTYDWSNVPKRGTWIATTSPSVVRTLAVQPDVVAPLEVPDASVELWLKPDVEPDRVLAAVRSFPMAVEIQYKSVLASHYVVTGPINEVLRVVFLASEIAEASEPRFVSVVHLLATTSRDVRTRLTQADQKKGIFLNVPVIGVKAGRSAGEAVHLAIPQSSLEPLANTLLEKNTSTVLCVEDSAFCLLMVSVLCGHPVSVTGSGYLPSEVDIVEDIACYLPSEVDIVEDIAWRRLMVSHLLSSELLCPEWHVCMAEPEVWESLQTAGIGVEAIDRTGLQTLNVYRATSADGKHVREEVITALRLARPAFLAARGEFTLDTLAGKQTIPLVSVLPTDLDRFSLVRGEWIGEDRCSLVLEETNLSRLGLTVETAIGRNITCQWIRRDAFGRDQELAIQFKIVGISRENAIHADLAWNIARWVQGKVNFIDGEFQTPMQQEATYGARRVKLVVSSPEHIVALTRRFESEGFLVSSQIERQQALVTLAATLRHLTVLLCGAALLLSMLLVITSVYLFYDARKSEIATLRSLGVSRKDIVKGFLVEALFFGTLSFLIGVALFVLAAPVYSDLVSRAFGMDRSVVRIGILAPGACRLLCNSLSLALAYALMAQLLPIWVAVRRPILSAMRS